MTIEQEFENRKKNPLLNTSYPIDPKQWQKYIKDKPLEFEEGDICFYVHIPFCKKICSFCEYSKIVLPDENVQKKYLTVLERDISSFLDTHKNIILRGFDIGGGTPTSLSDESFELLLDIYKNTVSRVGTSADYEPSIEATFDTLNENKINLIAKSVIKRVSLGLQSTSDDVLLENNRDNVSLDQIRRTMSCLYAAGIEKINLDFMYGIKGQSLQSIEKDLKVISFLKPQQLTVYELRTNMINISPYKSPEELFEEYSLIYERLLAIGYKANFGQNTFSLNDSDFGVSSYLRNRMIKGLQYKGFGISAQSMSVFGVSYNKGKSLCEIRKCLDCDSWEERIAYFMPKREVLSKFIAISGYSGAIDLSAASRLFGQSVLPLFKEEIEFLGKMGCIMVDGDVIRITRKGFQYYGAVFSMFFLQIGDDRGL